MELYFLNPSFPTQVHLLSVCPHPWPHLSCISVFLCGLTCVEPSACVGTLVCQQWNGCGWQASGRQRETGAEEAWLTDGSADTLRAWEEMRGGGSRSTTAPPLSLTGPLLLVCHISPLDLHCCSLSGCHLLLFKGLCVSRCWPLPSVTASLPITLYPSRSLSFSSHSPNHTFFLLPCVSRDMNAAAAPFLVRSWPSSAVPTSPL